MTFGIIASREKQRSMRGKMGMEMHIEESMCMDMKLNKEICDKKLRKTTNATIGSLPPTRNILCPQSGSDLGLLKRKLLLRKQEKNKKRSTNCQPTNSPQLSVTSAQRGRSNWLICKKESYTRKHVKLRYTTLHYSYWIYTTWRKWRIQYVQRRW